VKREGKNGEGRRSFIDRRFDGIGGKAAILSNGSRFFFKTGATKSQTAALDPISITGGPFTTTNIIFKKDYLKFHFARRMLYREIIQ
jgi:hypothetical protein